MREKPDAHEQHDMNGDDANLQPSLQPIPNHPLASIIGMFEGEGWDEVLAEIQRARQADRDYWEQVFEQQQDAS